MFYLIALLFLSALVLWGFDRLKVRYVFAWLWTILVCTIVWGGILALQITTRGEAITPRVFALLTWGTDSEIFFVWDAISGPFALALTGLGLAVVLTGAQRLVEGENSPDERSAAGVMQLEDWRNQAAILILMGWGLLGALAGNPLTLLLAWAGYDLFGLWVLLIRITNRQASERIVLDFSTRVAGILFLSWAMVVARVEGSSLSFEQIPPEVNVYLLLACGFRLGVLPLQVYFFENLPLRRGLGMMVRMATPVVSSLMLLVRVGAAEDAASADGILQGVLLILTLLPGLYGGYSWLVAKNELEGRSFWVLGMGALGMASAIRGQGEAAQAWGLALLLCGGGLFLFSTRSLWLRGVMAISAALLSALPGMPTALGMNLYADGLDVAVLPFILVQALLLAGFVRHLWGEGQPGQYVVRAIYGAYALGLIILPLSFVVAEGIGTGLPEVWWLAVVVVVIAGIIGLRVRQKGGQLDGGSLLLRRRGILLRFFSFHWLYRFFWRGYRLLGGGVAFVSVLLEGEAGVLWTLLLLFLLISLITTQVGAGG